MRAEGGLHVPLKITEILGCSGTGTGRISMVFIPRLFTRWSNFRFCLKLEFIVWDAGFKRYILSLCFISLLLFRILLLSFTSLHLSVSSTSLPLFVCLFLTFNFSLFLSFFLPLSLSRSLLLLLLFPL